MQYQVPEQAPVKVTHLTPSRSITNEDDYKRRLNWAQALGNKSTMLEKGIGMQAAPKNMIFPFPVPIVEYGFKKGLTAPDKALFPQSVNTAYTEKSWLTSYYCPGWNGTKTATSHQCSPLTMTPPSHPKGSSCLLQPSHLLTSKLGSSCLGKPLKSSTLTPKHDGSFPRVKNIGSWPFKWPECKE